MASSNMIVNHQVSILIFLFKLVMILPLLILKILSCNKPNNQSIPILMRAVSGYLTVVMIVIKT